MSRSSTVEANDLCTTRLFSERHLENQIFTGNYRGGRMELGDKSMHWSKRKVAGECNFPQFCFLYNFFCCWKSTNFIESTTTVLCVRLKRSIRSSKKANYDKVYGRLGIMDSFLNQILKEKAEQNHTTTIHQKARNKDHNLEPPSSHKISSVYTHTHK